jgi:signal transduction histidine kinase
MTLRTRLLLSQLPLAAALLIVALIARAALSSFGENAENILKDNYASVLAAQHMRDAADELARRALLGAITKRPLVAEELRDGRRAFESALAFQEGNITEVGEREMTERARTNWIRYQAELDHQVGVAVAEQEQNLPRLLEALAVLERSTTEVVEVNQDAMVRKSDRAQRETQRINLLMLLGTLVACAGGVAFSTVLTTRTMRPLSVLSQAVRRLGQGDLVARAKLDGRDEIAELAREFNTMADHLSEYRSSSLGELLQAQRGAQAAIDSLPDPVLVLAIDGALMNANQAAEALLGISVEEADPLARADSSVRELVRRMSEHVRAGKGPYVPAGLEEAQAIPTSDGVRFLLARANPVAGENGGLVGVTVLLQDVSRLRRFDELKNDLVATVAHEFRTPLTSLRMAIHLCAEEAVGPLNPKQADLIGAAREDCERLQTIVDDLLDLSRIQAGRIELHTRAVTPSSLLETALEPHRAIARERQIELAVSPQPSERPVLADPDRVQLVLTNLVANALRHTPAGGRVELSALGDDGQVRFEVADNGVGIAAEFQSRLFERFFRVPGAPPGGAGLGLYIAKEIVEAHGGHIGVESAPGQGARFWFTLPAAPQPSS